MSKSSEGLSPWGMARAQSVEIYPLKDPFKAEIALPGSKSFTNRALIMAALAEGTSVLRAPLFSDDSYWCANAFSKLGVGVRAERENDLVTIQGSTDGKLRLQDSNDLPYIGSAGTIARFLPGVVAARGEGEITLTSSDQLAKRPVVALINALRGWGADIKMPESASFPMVIRGGSLKGGTTTISGKVSSQFISGLLIAAPLAERDATIKVADHIVQADYVRITLALMKDFGVHVDHDDKLMEFQIKPQNYQPRDMQLEADASTATYFFALAAATRSHITIANLNPDTLQPDIQFVNHLKTLGCTVEQTGTRVSVQGPKQLKGGMSFDFKGCSDSTPAFVGIAPFAADVLSVRGVAHIRTHECDRISVMHQTLKDAGIKVEEYEDGLRIWPGKPQHVVVNPHDDHRMAMTFSVMAAAANGATITDPSCVSKTCPNFFDLLQKIGIEHHVRFNNVAHSGSGTVAFKKAH
ncbi:MAG: 3-phosphoshikimate 1-carboxyvinyltransferase [Alphaproteobacteria bacterium]